jgi:hypothetical protein
MNPGSRSASQNGNPALPIKHTDIDHQHNVSSTQATREGHQISPFEEFLFNFQKEREITT